MKWFVSALASVLLLAPVCAQEVLLPPEIRGPKGFPIVIKPLKVDGGDVRWKVSTGLYQFDLADLYDFPKEMKAKGIVVTGENGTYEVWAWNAKGDKASPLAIAKVVIGTGIPDVKPDPKPIPPKPDPDPKPDPKPDPTPSVAPIALDGLHILIIEESDDRGSLPLPQYSMLMSKEMRAWLTSKCTPMPDDGSQGWRMYDKDDDVKKVWADAMKRTRTQIPWLIISNPRKGSYEGSLPANETEFKALVTKYLN